jgi:hypothetical protein
MNTYVCTRGHVEPAPTAGQLDHCAHLVQVRAQNNAIVGWAPCGCGIVRVPQDDGLEAAYASGGAQAVLSLLRERLAAPPTLLVLPANWPLR